MHTYINIDAVVSNCHFSNRAATQFQNCLGSQFSSCLKVPTLVNTLNLPIANAVPYAALAYSTLWQCGPGLNCRFFFNGCIPCVCEHCAFECD